MWLKLLIGSVNDLVSFNLVRIIEDQLGFHQRQVTDCNSSPVIPASFRASETPPPHPYQASQSSVPYGSRVGLSKENFKCLCKAKFLRVLFKVVGRGVAQELTSSYISQCRIKEIASFLPLMLFLFVKSISFLAGEPFYNIGGNANLCSLYGKYYAVQFLGHV